MDRSIIPQCLTFRLANLTNFVIQPVAQCPFDSIQAFRLLPPPFLTTPLVSDTLTAPNLLSKFIQNVPFCSQHMVSVVEQQDFTRYIKSSNAKPLEFSDYHMLGLWDLYILLWKLYCIGNKTKPSTSLLSLITELGVT